MATEIREFAHLEIPLEVIQKATNNFSDENIIGKGGFGYVYKGQITHRGELTNIVARRSNRRHGQAHVEFWTEISVLSGNHHEYYNTVELIGYVDEKEEKIIINRDNFAKGSLVKYLSDPTFTWSQRLYMSIDLARAIGYIHHWLDQSYYIIHRNINSYTVLLDDDWGAWLSGFEYSIKHPRERRNQTFLCDEVIGTHGYMDPAYLKSGGVTEKTDIYSFGVVLFELMCGRKAKDQDNKKLLASMAKLHYENGTMHEIIHPDLLKQMDQGSLKCFSKAAYSCLQEERAQRPDAEKVLGKLKEAYNLKSTYDIQVEYGTYKEYEEHDKDEYEEYENDTNNGKDAEDESESDQNDEEDDNQTYEVHKEFKHLRIRFKDIQFATDNFNNFSKKYKGIDGYNNDTYKTELKCVDREYLTSVELKNNGKLPKRRYIVKITYIKFARDEVYKAVEVLLNCKHLKVESILGYCKKGVDMILVHEYFSTKELSTCLIYKTLNWDTRLKVCLDIARGLNYLHHDMENGKAVIHCDINSGSIELDKDWEAKIVDFRSAIYMPPNLEDDALNLNVPYLHNPNDYTDLEYYEDVKLNRESDVYNFGEIMLQMLCGWSENKRLGELVRGWLDEGTIYTNVDSALKGENGENIFLLNKGPNKDSLDAFINIASRCVAVEKSQRPTLKVIIKELEEALSFQKNNKDILRMSLEEIKRATQNFNRVNDIGGGGFGRVYKGKFAEKDGNRPYTVVAKKLDTQLGQGEKQFYNELQILYDYRHENIIGLVGYSNDTSEKIIVYEHAPKGSLDKYLSDTSLTWKNRLSICIDFVSGLDFLHGGGHGQETVIHRDIKAANILLFENWKAKVGDFGLSMISTVNKETHYVIDHVCGTKGYLDPLYSKTGFLTLESDIYSLGVVLFEILCGSTTFEVYKLKGQILPCFIKHIFKEGKQSEMVFHAIKDEIEQNSLTTFQNIAYQCLDDDREKRPTSKEVLAQLKNAMELQVQILTQTLEEMQPRHETQQKEIGNMKKREEKQKKELEELKGKSEAKSQEVKAVKAAMMKFTRQAKS